MSTHNVLLWRNKKKYQCFLIEKAPYLEVCFTFNIKTGQLIRPLLGSTKGGLKSKILWYISIENMISLLLLHNCQN